MIILYIIIAFNRGVYTVEPQDFTHDCLLTESRIDVAKTNKYLLKIASEAFVDVGNILDQIKKNTYYNKPFNTIQLEEYVGRLEVMARMIRKATTRQELDVKEDLDIDPRLFHAILGIATESTELVEATMHKEVDTVNVREEVGDVLYYVAVLLDTLGSDFRHAMFAEIEKLKARYPDGEFSESQAIDRDLDNERDVLEKHHK